MLTTDGADVSPGRMCVPPPDRTWRIRRTGTTGTTGPTGSTGSAGSTGPALPCPADRVRSDRARSGSSLSPGLGPGLGRAALFTAAAAAAAGGLLGAGGCRTGRPEYTVNVPPNVVDIRPPRSVLVVQTPLRLEALQQIIDRSLPGALPGGGGGQGSGQVGALPVSWRLSRQPAAIGPSPEGIELRIPIVGELQIGGGFLSCRSGGIGGTLTVRARPTLDGDGALNLQDYVLTHAAFGLNPRIADVIARFAQWDADGNGVITLAEFMPGYRRHQLSDDEMPFLLCVD